MNKTDLYGLLKQSADAFFKQSTSEPTIMVTDITGSALESAFWGNIQDVFVRSKWRCQMCFRFLHHYGGLAVIDEKTKSLVPLFWNADASKNALWASSFGALKALFAKAKPAMPFNTFTQLIGM
jgi:hypothetical protein